MAMRKTSKTKTFRRGAKIMPTTRMNMPVFRPNPKIIDRACESVHIKDLSDEELLSKLEEQMQFDTAQMGGTIEMRAHFTRKLLLFRLSKEVNKMSKTDYSKVPDKQLLSDGMLKVNMIAQIEYLRKKVDEYAMLGVPDFDNFDELIARHGGV